MRSAQSNGGSSDRPLSSLTEAYENLNKHERWWMERCDFLESRGYRLRPRFRPGWVPSWHRTGQDPVRCEDARFHLTKRIIDATRLSDSTQVILKAVRRDGDEAGIAMMLSTPEALEDPMNHCVPILGFFGDSNTRGPDFIVMPVLRRFHRPDFCTVSEIVDFVRQTLEGLVYMHRCGVAHRDLTEANILMDGKELYPDGAHPDPLWNDFLPDEYVLARSLKRSEARKVTYYFIDFGISSHFGDALEPRLVTGIDGRDRQVPELDLKKPYDPFLVDIFTLGSVYGRLFRRFTNLAFLSPLAEEMTNKTPGKRPTANDALARFHELMGHVEGVSLNKRLRPVDEPIMVHYIHELSFTFGTFLQTVQRTFARRGVAYVVIPVGISVVLLYRGNHGLFARLRSMFSATRN